MSEISIVSLESLRVIHLSRETATHHSPQVIVGPFARTLFRYRRGSLATKHEMMQGKGRDAEEARARAIPGNRLPRAMRSSRRSCTHRLVVGGYRDVLILPRVPRGEIDTHRVIRFPFLSSPLCSVFSRAMG